MLKVLIIGGYGTFGGRLAQLMAGDRRVDLVLAGRSLAKAQAFCNRLGGAAVPAAFDRDGDVERQLRALAPAVVVDATGPFQLYGHDPYRVVKAALAAGIHYLDLADDPAFVEGIAQFDAQARDRGLFVLAGVSSFPVLTAAVVRALSHDMVRVLDVTCGIAPSPYANVGLNVIRAIASYAGKPVLGVAGRTIGHALIDTRRFTIAPPGAVPLVPIRFSLVDVPDLRVLPALWPDLRTVWTGAGPVPEIWHRLLSALAWLVRLGLLHSLAPLAPLINRAKSALSWGEHRGGMLVAVGGVDADGRRIERSWHLLAEGEDGPIIPSMAAAAIVHRCLSGHPPAPGARNAAAELELRRLRAVAGGAANHDWPPTRPAERSQRSALSPAARRRVGAPAQCGCRHARPLHRACRERHGDDRARHVAARAVGRSAHRISAGRPRRCGHRLVPSACDRRALAAQLRRKVVRQLAAGGARRPPVVGVVRAARHRHGARGASQTVCA